jgi:hypothetical protein
MCACTYLGQQAFVLAQIAPDKNTKRLFWQTTFESPLLLASPAQIAI